MSVLRYSMTYTVLPDALQPLHEALEQLGWQVVA
jgi:hypothetical protein